MKKIEQKKGVTGKSNDGNRSLQPGKSTGASADVMRPNFGGHSNPDTKVTLTREQVAERAYCLWQQKGRPHGQDVICWLQAEAELRREGTEKKR